MNADENDENPPLAEPEKVNESNEVVDEIVSAELVSEKLVSAELVAGESETESSPEASGDEVEGSIWATLVEPSGKAVADSNQAQSPTSPIGKPPTWSPNPKPQVPAKPTLPFTPLCRVMQVLLILTTICSTIFFLWFFVLELEKGEGSIRFARNTFLIFVTGSLTFSAIFWVKPQHIGNETRSLVWASLTFTFACMLLQFPPQWMWVTFAWFALHLPQAIVMNLAPRPEQETQFDIHDSVAANGGAVASITLGIWSILGSFFSSLSIINSLLGVCLGMWGLTSRKKKSAVFGILLCLLGIAACMFSLSYYVWDVALPVQDPDVETFGNPSYPYTP